LNCFVGSRTKQMLGIQLQSIYLVEKVVTEYVKQHYRQEKREGKKRQTFLAE
jgi:hypothetical protein